jgi:adenosine kinase
VKIIVSGSLAYDRIMDFPGYFAEHILPEKIHVLNVAFTVNGMKEKFGGTAGNIAYALSLMEEKPEISATIGQDHYRYTDWLKKIGLPIEGVKIIDEEFTAGAYITTDKSDNQITGFNPGAMKCSSCLDFEQLDPKETFMIISPGNLSDMVKYPQLCKEKGIEYIFDPGQSIPMMSPEDLCSSIKGSRMLICNDYELELIMSKTGLSTMKLLELTDVLIVTLGESGSKIITKDSEKMIPAAKARKVEDPTGAGDSFRGGLISGLVKGRSIEDAARLGSVCASFAVECYGTQEYQFTLEEFDERYKNCFTGEK